ncbi:MAG: ADP-ribosylglycohydrolase family protein, partial [Clostridia bacterium]|nr:ADP-ribosylglycohydrolase family protein [Clostridia bacterium]
MYGAIIGDVVGSVYEFHNIKTKDFPWLTEKNRFTDDTVMTVAVADAILKNIQKNCINDIESFKYELCSAMHYWGRTYWKAGYGQKFIWWLMKRSREPYNS